MTESEFNMSFGRKVLLFSLLFVPMVLFYIFTAYYSVNVGWTDDWHCVEAFMVAWDSHQGVLERIGLLVSQMNEHRVLYVRLFTLLSYALFGEINHNFLTFSGALHLLIIPVIFCKILDSERIRWTYLIPAVYIIFSIQPYENNFWVITSLQHSIAIIFSAWVFYLISFHNDQKSLYFAAVLLVVAMFTNGNGMFGFIAALPVVLLKRTPREKVIWVTLSVLCFVAYFYDFKMPSHKPSVSANLTDYFFLIIIDFFAFFGSVIDTSILSFRVGLRYNVSIIAGAIAWLFLAIPFVVFLYDLAFKNYRKNRWTKFLTHKFKLYPNVTFFVFSCFIFVSLSGLAFAVSRASLGVQEVYNSRYKAIPIFFYLIIYLTLVVGVKTVNRTRLLQLAVVFGVLFHVYSYYLTWDDVYNFRKTKVLTQLNWDNNGRNFFYVFPNSRTPDDHVPIRAYKKLPIPPVEFTAFVPGLMKYYNDALFLSRKHYRFYTTPNSITKFSTLLYSETTQANLTEERVDVVETDSGFTVNVSNAVIPFLARKTGYYILFVNDDVRMSFPLNNEANKLPTFLRTWRYYNSELLGGVGKNSLPSGAYELKIVRIQNGSVRLLKVINVEF